MVDAEPAVNPFNGSTLDQPLIIGEPIVAATKKLAKFTVTEAGESFNLHIEDEAGDVLELSATREQIDVVADALADLLEAGDDADEVKS